MTNQSRTVALIGSGRWGRVHASNLARLLSPSDRVLWVSQHNRDRANEIIGELPGNGPSFELCNDVADALQSGPTALLVINRPADHFAIAKSGLNSGSHVFVEKPLCLRLDEARTLVELASRQQRVLAVGLHLLSASYLSHFRAQLANRAISRIRVRWGDPEFEIRYGEEKRANRSAPLAHDLYPHFWSIICALTGAGTLDMVSASRQPNGAVSVNCRTGQIECEAVFHRGADARVRSVEIFFADGGFATLDFTQEPGISACDGAILPVDWTWSIGPRPLMREIQMFFEHIAAPPDRGDWLQLAANCIDSVAGAENLDTQLAQL